MNVQENIFQTLAKALAYLLHPVLMVTAGVAILLFGTGSFIMMPFNAKIFILSATVVGTVLLPLALVPVYYLFQFTSGVQMPDKNERIFPLIFSSILYFYTYHYLVKLGLHGIIPTYILAAAIIVFLVALVNMKWKISMHATAIGGLTGLLLALTVYLQFYSIFWLSLIIVASGFISTARLYTSSHTPTQVYYGYLLGFSIVFIAIAFRYQA